MKRKLLCSLESVDIFEVILQFFFSSKSPLHLLPRVLEPKRYVAQIKGVKDLGEKKELNVFNTCTWLIAIVDEI